jgi:hypothetical protein
MFKNKVEYYKLGFLHASLLLVLLSFVINMVTWGKGSQSSLRLWLWISLQFWHPGLSFVTSFLASHVIRFWLDFSGLSSYFVIQSRRCLQFWTGGCKILFLAATKFRLHKRHSASSRNSIQPRPQMACFGWSLVCNFPSAGRIFAKSDT